MKKLLVVVIALALLLAAVGVAQAQDEVFILLPMLEEGYTVNPDQIVYIAFGWGACNPGLVKTAQNALGFEITVDGAPLYELVHKDPYWGTPYPIGQFEECFPDPHAVPTEADWIYPLDLSQFELGEEYEMSFSLWLNHQITDGFDYDENGLPDFYNGVLLSGSFNLTVVDSP
jgi:hypothetical protein